MMPNRARVRVRVMRRYGSARRRSREPNVGCSLVLAAVRVLEGYPELTRVGGLEGERERGILAHALGRVEGHNRLAQVRGHDSIDVLIVSLDDLALLVALHALHRVTDQRAHAHDVARLDGGR